MTITPSGVVVIGALPLDNNGELDVSSAARFYVGGGLEFAQGQAPQCFGVAASALLFVCALALVCQLWTCMFYSSCLLLPLQVIDTCALASGT